MTSARDPFDMNGVGVAEQIIHVAGNLLRHETGWLTKLPFSSRIIAVRRHDLISPRAKNMLVGGPAGSS